MRPGYFHRFYRGFTVLFVTGLALCLVSCDSLVSTYPESKLPDIKPRLVIQSFISPQDTFLRVVVSETTPVFAAVAPAEKVLDHAEVLISDDRGSVRLPYDSVSRLYMVRSEVFPVRPGTTYKLTVREGNRLAEATTTVPEVTIPITGFEIDTAFTTMRGPFSRRDSAMVVQFSWEDPPQTANYYRTRAFMSVDVSTFDGWNSSGEFIEGRTEERHRFTWDDSFSQGEFQQDQNQNGRTMASSEGKTNFRLYHSRPTENGTVYAKERNKVRYWIFELLHTDENYYRYHRSVELARNSDNPFAEPALVFTNVTGGLGVFASFNSFSTEIKP